jgi:hypothetical protein
VLHCCQHVCDRTDQVPQVGPEHRDICEHGAVRCVCVCVCVRALDALPFEGLQCVGGTHSGQLD